MTMTSPACPAGPAVARTIEGLRRSVGRGRRGRRQTRHGSTLDARPHDRRRPRPTRHLLIAAFRLQIAKYSSSVAGGLLIADGRPPKAPLFMHNLSLRVDHRRRVGRGAGSVTDLDCWLKAPRCSQHWRPTSPPLAEHASPRCATCDSMIWHSLAVRWSKSIQRLTAKRKSSGWPLWRITPWRLRRKFDDILLETLRHAQQAGGKLLASSDDFVTLTSNKHQTALALERAGLPTPGAVVLSADRRETADGVRVPGRLEACVWRRFAAHAASVWAERRAAALPLAATVRALLPRHGGQRGHALRTYASARPCPPADKR